MATLDPRACVHCGAEFVPKSNNGKLCSDNCRRSRLSQQSYSSRLRKYEKEPEYRAAVKSAHRQYSRRYCQKQKAAGRLFVGMYLPPDVSAALEKSASETGLTVRETISSLLAQALGVAEPTSD